MRIIFLGLIVFFNSLGFAQDGFPINDVEKNFEPIYAFTNANIIVSPYKKIKKGTLIIKGDKILSADTNTIIPRGAIIRDLDNAYVYPSFIDLYSEYGIRKIKSKDRDYQPQYKTSKKGARHWNESIHPEIISAELFETKNDIAKNYRSIGFGAVLSHDQNGIFRGTGCLNLLSEKTAHKNTLLINAATFYSFNKGNSNQKYPTSLMGSIALIKQTLLDADWYSLNKNHANISFLQYNKHNDLPKIFDIGDVLNYSRLNKISDEFEIDFIIKGDGFEFQKIEEVKNCNSKLIVPVNFPKHYEIDDPEKIKWTTLKELKKWETAPFNLKILENHNIEFAITTSGLKNKKDFLPNLRKSIANGFSKSRALASLTIIPASIMNIDDKIGTLENGKLANFIICSGDVFEDAIIYENWVLGEKYNVNKKILDIRGSYTLKRNLEETPVDITGPLNKLLFTDLDDSLKFSISVNDNEIIINNKNEYRCSGIFFNNKIKGRCQNHEGNFYDFFMQRDSLLNEEEQILNANSDSDVLTPAIWSPNKAYGFIETPTKENIIFRNATIWTNENEGILYNADLAIKNGKILSIGQSLDLKSLFEKNDIVKEINVYGKHITCGIIDEHSHIAISNGVNESSESVTAEVSIGDVINPDDHNIYRQLAGGVTCVQLLHGSANPIGGKSAIIKLRWGSKAEDMKVEAAPTFIKFALGENVKQSNWGDFNTIRFPQTRMGVEQVFYDAFYRAKKYEEEWEKYNQLNNKEKNKTIAPREDLELNTLVDILNENCFITCHSYVQSEINMLMHVADSMGFSVNTFTHILEGYKIADKLKKHGAAASTFSDWWAYKFEVNDAIPYNAALLNDAGVLTGINSDDAEMGRRLNQEAAKAIKYGGVSEEDAWKMITLNPAKMLHLDKQMGSIKIGKDADIVIWSNNPLSVYSKVESTYIDGVCLYNNEIDISLRERDLNEKMRIIKIMEKEEGEGKKVKKEIEHLYHCDSIDEEH